eukprot:tig00021525_g22134.t1
MANLAPPTKKFAQDDDDDNSRGLSRNQKKEFLEIWRYMDVDKDNAIPFQLAAKILKMLALHVDRDSLMAFTRVSDPRHGVVTLEQMIQVMDKCVHEQSIATQTASGHTNYAINQLFMFFDQQRKGRVGAHALATMLKESKELGIDPKLVPELVDYIDRSGEGETMSAEDLKRFLLRDARRQTKRAAQAAQNAKLGEMTVLERIQIKRAIEEEDARERELQAQQAALRGELDGPDEADEQPGAG